MQTHFNPASALLYLAVLAFIVFRLSRPQKMNAVRFWVFPGFVVLLTGWLIYVTFAGDVPGVPLYGSIAAALGLVLGIPLGIARGHHSKVRLGDQPGTFVVDPSMVVMLIWLGAFAVRFLIRVFLPVAGPVTIGATDGLLVFAVSTVLTARVVIFRKYRQLAAGT